MTTNSALTDEILREVIEQMPNPTFDSHELIQQLMRRHPRDYATALHMTAGQDPIQALHATIGRRLTAFDIVEKTGNVKSMNVRGEVSDNEGWRKKYPPDISVATLCWICCSARRAGVSPGSSHRGH